MAGDVVEGSLKEALYESVLATLSPIQSVRVAGEERIKALEMTDEFGVHLAELTMTTAVDVSVRQLACVLLKQYVEIHWSSLGNKFTEPEVPLEAKSVIRELLPPGLEDDSHRIRVGVAYAMSAIARWDWPDAWPQLFQVLMGSLTSGKPQGVHGAMRVLTEFCRELTDQQVLHVSPLVLPEMFKILSDSQQFSVRTRSRAVNIFSTLVDFLGTLSEVHKGVGQLLAPLLPNFMQCFLTLLGSTNDELCDSGLRKEILEALTTLMRKFPGLMKLHLTSVLPAVWNILTSAARTYVAAVVHATEPTDDPVDSDGEVLGFENLVHKVFEFVHVLIEMRRYRSSVKGSVAELMYYTVLYMQITEDQVQTWSNNPDQFVEDEDDDTFSYSVRISAQDLLSALCSEFRKESGAALCSAVTQHLQEAEQARNAQQPFWWKMHEACLLALGSVSSLLSEILSKNPTSFDFNSLIQNVVLKDIYESDSPFLIGRALWFGSRFPDLATPELMQKLLDATVRGLAAEQPDTVRISAIRAVHGFCEYLKKNNNTLMLEPYLLQMLDGIVSTAQRHSTDVLSLCLHTIDMIASVHEGFTASQEAKLTPLGLAVFLKYNQDPELVGLCQSLFSTLAAIPDCYPIVLQRLLPTICSILLAEPNSSSLPLGLPSIALDVLECLVRRAPKPIPASLIEQGFPAACKATLTLDDNDAMQSGGECIRAFVSTAVQQIAEWKDDQGESGVKYVLRVAGRLLDPKTSEYSASFAGRLVSVLIQRLGEGLGSNTGLLLRAVLSKLQSAQSLSVIQSLVLVFAQLARQEQSLDAVLEFLCTVPDAGGLQPALVFVMSQWLSKQHMFYGAYENKVSVVALATLLQHLLRTGDPRLRGITLQGDPKPSTAGGIRTRSKATQEPEQCTEIWIGAKIFKALVNELNNQMEAAETNDDDDEETCSEDEDSGEWEDDGGGKTLQQLLDDLETGTGSLLAGDIVDDDEEDDPDAVDDPINQVDLLRYLRDLLLGWCSQQQEFNSQIVPSLTDAERTVLSRAAQIS